MAQCDMVWHGMGIPLDRRYKSTSTFGGTVELHRTVWGKVNTRQSGSASPSRSTTFALGSLHSISNGKGRGPCVCSPTAVPLQILCRWAWRGDRSTVQALGSPGHPRPALETEGGWGSQLDATARSASPKVHHIEGLTLHLVLAVADNRHAPIWPGVI